MTNLILKVDGEVAKPLNLSYEDLRGIAAPHQIKDVSALVPNRTGAAVTLEGILSVVGVHETARFLGLHSSHDDFHASVPLAEVRSRGLVIYQKDGAPLRRDQGGPVRFFIPGHARCKTAEIDQCANVKFVDHIELTVERGYDNRPDDEEKRAELHGHES